MTADHRSVHPNIPGVPWWGAVLIAVTLTAIGFAYDAGSGNKELSAVFAASYVVGCILAVLAVRQSGIFTAVIQPPLLLFVSVPTRILPVPRQSSSRTSKTLLINCAYPLIERFPLMFFTSAVVLLIGMARWYTGMSSRRGTPRDARPKDVTSASGRLCRRSRLRCPRCCRAEPAEDRGRRRHRRAAPQALLDRPGRATKRAASPARAARTAAGLAQPSRSRHARPPETEIIEPVADRPRRPRPARHVRPAPGSSGRAAAAAPSTFGARTAENTAAG